MKFKKQPGLSLPMVQNLKKHPQNASVIGNLYEQHDKPGSVLNGHLS